MARRNRAVEPEAEFDVPENIEPAASVDQSAAAPVAATLAKESSEPSDLQEALALLKRAESLPENTASRSKLKQAAVKAARRVVFLRQQGLPVITISADDMAAASVNSAAEVKRARLESLARSTPEVRELLDERDALAAQVAKLSE